jgi:hypothetical protein
MASAYRAPSWAANVYTAARSRINIPQLHHAPYFHDGSAPDLPAVVEHYDQWFGLNLTLAQKADLVEYLKSL